MQPRFSIPVRFPRNNFPLNQLDRRPEVCITSVRPFQQNANLTFTSGQFGPSVSNEQHVVNFTSSPAPSFSSSQHMLNFTSVPQGNVASSQHNPQQSFPAISSPSMFIPNLQVLKSVPPPFVRPARPTLPSTSVQGNITPWNSAPRMNNPRPFINQSNCFQKPHQNVSNFNTPVFSITSSNSNGCATTFNNLGATQNSQQYIIPGNYNGKGSPFSNLGGSPNSQQYIMNDPVMSSNSICATQFPNLGSSPSSQQYGISGNNGNASPFSNLESSNSRHIMNDSVMSSKNIRAAQFPNLGSSPSRQQYGISGHNGNASPFSNFESSNSRQYIMNDSVASKNISAAQFPNLGSSPNSQQYVIPCNNGNASPFSNMRGFPKNRQYIMNDPVMSSKNISAAQFPNLGRSPSRQYAMNDSVMPDNNNGAESFPNFASTQNNQQFVMNNSPDFTTSNSFQRNTSSPPNTNENISYQQTNSFDFGTSNGAMANYNSGNAAFSFRPPESDFENFSCGFNMNSVQLNRPFIKEWSTPQNNYNQGMQIPSKIAESTCNYGNNTNISTNNFHQYRDNTRPRTSNFRMNSPFNRRKFKKQNIETYPRDRSNSYQNSKQSRYGNQFKNENHEISKPLSCDTCDRAFSSNTELDDHLSEHIKCDSRNCQFEAHPKIVALHKKMQHETGYAAAISKLKDAEEIKKWREERKRRFPTLENVLKRKAEQAEKEARGEVIETKEFGKFKKQKVEQDGPRNNYRANGFKRRRRRGFKSANYGRSYSQPIVIGSGSESDSDDDSHIKLPKFLGMSVLENVSCVKQNKEAKDEENCILVQSNEIDPLQNVKSATSPHPTVKENRIVDEKEMCPLLADEMNEIAQPDRIPDLINECSDESPLELPIIKDSTEKDLSVDDMIEEHPSSLQTNKRDFLGLKNELLSDCPVDKAPLTEISNSSNAIVKTAPDIHDSKITNESHMNASKEYKRYERSARVNEVYTLPRKSSLLEKLLADDIRHERNVIMQCIRHIVKKNFFGIGTDH